MGTGEAAENSETRFREWEDIARMILIHSITRLNR